MIGPVNVITDRPYFIYKEFTMGYIVPSTTITFYRDTGLSPNYDNTLYFTTEADKNSYFSCK